MQIDEIIRSKRKTIALIVERDGRLVVRAPNRASMAQIQHFVMEKAAWIRAKQTQVAANPAPAPRRYRDGELFYYLGERYPLHLVTQQKDGLVFANGVFNMRKSEKKNGQKRFIDWYRLQARSVIGERLASYAPRGGFVFHRVRITSAKTRWGSCGAGGSLNFPWRLVMAPLPVIDYVVVHELAHLAVRGHQKDFWALVADLMPDYQVKRNWLKEHGHLLVL